MIILEINTDEVNALMEGLSSGDISDQNTGIGSNLEVFLCFWH